MLDLLTGLTIGLHLASVHLPHDAALSGVNPGIYVRAANGVTVGAYRNSLGRPSAYAAWTLEDIGDTPFSLTAGAITGYVKKTKHFETPCPGYLHTEQITYMCSAHETQGGSSHDVALLLAPSVRLPELAGITPRITVLPKVSSNGITTVHFSLERKFP